MRLELPYVPHKNTSWPVPRRFLPLPHVLRIPHASQAVHQLQPGRWRSRAWFCSRRGRNPRARFVLGLFTAAEEGGGELAPTTLQTAPLQKGKTFPYPLSILELSCEPFFGCRKCFHLVPHCLKAVGNGVSVLGRWRPSFLPGRWYWFVLVADGQSALRAKAEIQSSEGAEIYCSRKLKMYASAYGVAPVLPLSVWGG